MMAPTLAQRGLRVSSGIRCTLGRPTLPGVRNYYVVALPTDAVSTRDVEDLHRLAHRIGRLLGRQHFGDAECYTLMYSAARTRRCPWPHVHLIVACSVADKRRNVLLLQLKHVLRWRRWRIFRWLFSWVERARHPEGCRANRDGGAPERYDRIQEDKSGSATEVTTSAVFAGFSGLRWARHRVQPTWHESRLGFRHNGATNDEPLSKDTDRYPSRRR